MPEEAITHTIDFNKSEQYILSIRLSTDGFSFSIYNPIRDSFILSHQREIKPELSFTANLKEAFKELDFLGYLYKEVNVLWTTKRYTLLPIELFAEDHADTCFYYNFSPKENEIILHDALPKNGAVVLFAMDKSLHVFLSEKYNSIQFSSSLKAPAEHFAVRSRIGSDRKIYMHLYTKGIELYGYERGHLMLLNYYACEQTSDRAYFLLYAWKQLGMDQLKDELYVFGEASNKEELIEELQRFIQHIVRLNLPTELNKP